MFINFCDIRSSIALDKEANSFYTGDGSLYKEMVRAGSLDIA